MPHMKRVLPLLLAVAAVYLYQGLNGTTAAASTGPITTHRAGIRVDGFGMRAGPRNRLPGYFGPAR